MNPPYAAVPRALIADRYVSNTAKNLYGVLTRFADRNRQAWPSQRTLAAEMEVSLATVERAVGNLRSCGWVAVERRWPGGPNRYTLQTEPTFPELDEDEDPGEDGDQAEAERDCEDAHEDVRGLTPPLTDEGALPSRMRAHTKRYPMNEENLAPRTALGGGEEIEDGFDPAKICGLFDTLPGRTPAKEPGARALAYELRDAWARERPEAIPGDINVAAVAGQISAMRRGGVSVAELRSMIDLFVTVKGFRAAGVDPWRCFLGRRHALLLKVRAAAEAKAAELDPEYWKPKPYDWREESAAWLAEQCGGVPA